MSTTTDHAASKANPVSGMLRHGRNMLLILTAWFSLSAGLTLIPNFTQTALVILPSRALLNNLPDGTSILAWSEASAILTSEKPGFVAGLYKAGAFIVMPARKNGCLTLQKKPPETLAASMFKRSITSATANRQGAPAS
jgi:hypothetical protein